MRDQQVPFVTQAKKVISQLKITCILGSFRNHDIDGNKNVKVAIGLIIITIKKIYSAREQKTFFIHFFSNIPFFIEYVVR